MTSPEQAKLDYETELIRRAASLSQDAWAEIYERNQPKLFRYIYARTGDRTTADDLTATVFVEALKGISSYRPQGRPLLAWLYAIARNVVNYHHRTRFRKRLQREDSAGDEPRAPAPEAADPASAVEWWDLREAVNGLSRQQREVILLRYYVGLTAPEVARVLRKHERAVYSLQTRAIQALRRRLT